MFYKPKSKETKRKTNFVDMNTIQQRKIEKEKTIGKFIMLQKKFYQKKPLIKQNKNPLIEYSNYLQTIQKKNNSFLLT